MRYFCEYQSPIGILQLRGSSEALEELRLPLARQTEPPKGHEINEAAFAPVITQLEEYFAGRRQNFSLSLAPRGTPFQLAVWEALLQVPFGQTATYGQIAALIGRPKAYRAVGLANNRNPIPLIIPCHRIIGSDGSLTGYGGGLDLKKRLLQLEQALVLPSATTV